MRYRNDYDAESTSNLITFDYDAVIQPPKVASEAGAVIPPYPRSVPRVGMLPPPPCERKHNVTPKVFSVTPSSCWVGYGWLVAGVKAPEHTINGNQ